MKQKTIILIVFAALLLGACSGSQEEIPPTAPAMVEPGTIEQAQPNINVELPSSSRTITVTGVSQVAVTPDIAYITVGSRQEADSVSEAVENSTATVGKIMEAVIAAGVAEEDIQTSNFSVYSTDKYTLEGIRSGSSYAVENTVYITVRDLTKMGEVLGEAVKAGANTVWGIQFDKSDKSEALSKGRAEAVEKAADQAQELADAAGVTLGELQSISHYSGYSTPYGAGMGGGAPIAASSAIAISPGQQYIQVDVTVTYLVE